jgi:murein DD-endopeptidase MepM/ murein hydrolase activator NlpD
LSPAPAPAPAAAPDGGGRLLEPTVTQAQAPPPSAPSVPEPNYSPPPVSLRPAEPPAAAPPPPPATRTVMRATITGKVVDAEGPPAIYTVQKGDSLYAIGRKLGISPEDLAKSNGIKKPYRLQPGDKIEGPRSKAKAYVIGEGDTLFAIARRFSVTAAAIAKANDMAVSANLKPGRKLVLPEGFRDRGPVKVEVTVPVEAPRAPAPRPQPPQAQTPPVQTPQAQPEWRPPVVAPPVQPAPRPVPAPVQPALVQPAPRPASPPPQTVPAPAPTPPPRPPAAAIVQSTPTPADLQISQLGRGRFVWPLRGDILSTFGPKGTGQRNDGLNIRASSGSTVRAAANGDVVYAGDQVPGFGNLVLIKHTDGWVTAYGHLARVDVKMQQQVVQGQQIGLSGATGGVAEPQLHFEVRYAPSPADRARPIDPNLVLPK